MLNVKSGEPVTGDEMLAVNANKSYEMVVMHHTICFNDKLAL